MTFKGMLKIVVNDFKKQHVSAFCMAVNFVQFKDSFVLGRKIIFNY